MGKAYFKLRQYSSAAKSLEISLKQDYSNDHQLILGCSFESMGKIKEAHSVFQELLRKNLPKKTRSEVLLGMARTSLSLSNYEAAEKLYFQVIEEAPSNLAPYLDLFKMLKKDASLETILWLRKKGDQYHTGNFKYHFALGEAFDARGWSERAKEEFFICSRQKPQNSLTFFRLFEVCQKAKEFVEGAEYLEKALLCSSSMKNDMISPTIVFKSAIFTANKGNYHRAFLFFRNSLLCDRSLLGENDEGALEKLKKFFASHGTVEEKQFFEAFSDFFNGEVGVAKSKMQKLLPNLSQNSFRRDAKIMIEECNKTLKAENEYLEYAAHMKALEDAQKAEKAALIITPAALANSEIGEKLRVNISNDPRIKQIISFAEANFGNPEIQYSAGIQLKKMGDFANARVLFAAGNQADSRHFGCWHELSRMYFFEKNWPKAKEAIEKALQINPKHASSLALSARIAYQEKDILDALKGALGAIEIDPKTAEARLVTANIYFESKRIPDALDEINKGIFAESDSSSPISQELFALQAKIREEAD